MKIAKNLIINFISVVSWFSFKSKDQMRMIHWWQEWPKVHEASSILNDDSRRGDIFFMACQDFEYCTLVRAWFLMSDNMGKQMLCCLWWSV